jgi:hypothetical protein
MGNMMYYLRKVQNIVVEIYVKTGDMRIAVSSIVFLHSQSCAIKTKRKHKKFGKQGNLKRGHVNLKHSRHSPQIGKVMKRTQNRKCEVGNW